MYIVFFLLDYFELQYQQPTDRPTDDLLKRELRALDLGHISNVVKKERQ